LRVRGRVWWLSVLWVGIGAAGADYSFFVTTKPFTNADFWIPLWNTEPEVISIAAYLAAVAWLVLPLPVLVAGLVRLRGWRPGRWLRAAAWASAWLAGFALMRQAGVWEEYPARYLTYACGHRGCSLNDYGPAVVSWGELAICATWLALGAVMTWILAVPAPGWAMSGTSSRASGKASLWPPGAGDLKP
jgi:hypothetical protein